MYNPLLNTFLVVADCGSFTKAAERLFISPTAVMKQMNNLEQHLSLKLIERTPAGIKLTPAGKIIFRDAKFIIDYSKKSIASAMAATRDYDTTFCVGTSMLNPAKPFMDMWYKLNQFFPDYKLHLVPFEDNHEGIPVNWDYSIPYGLLYSLDADKDVLRLVEKAKEITAM